MRVPSYDRIFCETQQVYCTSFAMRIFCHALSLDRMLDGMYDMLKLNPTSFRAIILSYFQWCSNNESRQNCQKCSVKRTCIQLNFSTYVSHWAISMTFLIHLSLRVYPVTQSRILIKTFWHKTTPMLGFVFWQTSCRSYIKLRCCVVRLEVLRVSVLRVCLIEQTNCFFKV